MKRLRRRFPIDFYDADISFISSRREWERRNAKRQKMINAGSSLITELAKGEYLALPTPSAEGMIMREAISRLARRECPCRESDCPSREMNRESSCDKDDSDQECDCGNEKGNCKNCNHP
jgi:hypothetical protein